MYIKIRLGNDTRQQLCERPQRARTGRYPQLIRRIQALLYTADEKPLDVLATSYIEVADALVRFANAPKGITALMGHYCESLGAAA